MIEYLSYSQYNTYVQCPRSWYLGKVVKAEEKQTWYLPLGSAVHAAVETKLAGGEPDVEAIFYGLVSEQLTIEPDTSTWLHGGSHDEPIVEARALQRVKDCYEKALEFLAEIDVWEVEYDASGPLPGLDVPLKAFVDIIGEHKKLGPVIVDWKSGASKPKNNFQLETYKALLEYQAFSKSATNSMVDTGLWAMLSPKASKARPVDLSSVSPKDVGEKYQAVYEQMVKKIYKTNAGYNCRFCFHQENCLLEAGPTPRARYYDKADTDGFPF